MNAAPAVEPEVLINRLGAIGRIRLNRPRALNSLTLDMVRSIAAALDAFERDKDIALVLLTGEGERGLCAGGDIKALFDSGLAGTALAQQFWREEYRLNARISHFPKPYVAVLDGITMGGGVGLSAHGSHRIVTGRTRLAMPETGIGFFPDVGGSWLLSRGPGELGTYLGLTGDHIGASDAIAASLADVFVPETALLALFSALAKAEPGRGAEQISDIIDAFGQPAPEPRLLPQQALIDQAFSFDTVEEIMAALVVQGGAFASMTVATLATKSPTSLKLSLALMRHGRASHTLEQCLERELAAAMNVLNGRDFYEGVRAAVIDKDRQPIWSPSRLADVDKAMIDLYLASGKDRLFA